MNLHLLTLRVRRAVVWAAALLSLALLTSECLNHPRNGQISASKSTAITFDGYLNAPNAEVQLFIQNNATGQLDRIAHSPILSVSNAITDKSNGQWFKFSATDVVLPSGNQYWSGANGYNVAHVKAVSGNLALATFDVNADACMNEQAQAPNGGGIAIIQNCASKQSPLAAINASCGAQGQDCCMSGSACTFGNTCVGGKCVSENCGGTNAACCPESPFCLSAKNVCRGGQCIACGATTQACCALNGCNPGNTCVGGTCQCGKAGLACCGNGDCESGTVCDNGICTKCGGSHDVCCINDTCNSGYTCVLATPPQCVCGGLGQSCCPNGGGCNAGLTCSSGTCAQPNEPPPTCSPVGGRCNGASSPYCCGPNVVCDYGTCKPCVVHDGDCTTNQKCCSWEDACVLDQFSGKPVCGIRDQKD